MITNREHLKVITDNDENFLLGVTTLLREYGKYGQHIKKTLNAKWNIVVECHSICRAISHLLPLLKVVDGKYIGMMFPEIDGKTQIQFAECDHSWLVTPDGSILDPYPVGVFTVAPLLVISSGKYQPFGKNMYMPHAKTTNEVITRKVWRQSRMLARYMKKAYLASPECN